MKSQTKPMKSQRLRSKSVENNRYGDDIRASDKKDSFLSRYKTKPGSKSKKIMALQELKSRQNHIHQIKPVETRYDGDDRPLVGKPAGQKMKIGRVSPDERKFGTRRKSPTTVEDVNKYSGVAQSRQVLEGNNGSIMYPQSFADPAGPLHTQLAPRVRAAKAVQNVVSNGDLISPQGEKRRTNRYPAQAATTTGSGKLGPLIDKKGITSPVETNTLDQSRIRSLLIKGFTIDEVKKMTKLDVKQIKSIAETVQGSDINQGSIDLYTELQRDLSKLVLLETQDGEKRDTNAILNAIKLQAELQEKKIQLNSTIQGTSFNPTKVSKDYINTRDKEILEMEQGGMDCKKISQVTGMSESSINQALDRAKLALPEDLFGINPSIITETRGLVTETRIDILRRAKQDNLNRNQVRSLVNQLKNEGR